MAKTTAHGERAQELIDEFPKQANKTLAAILAEEFKGTITLEQARSVVRYYRGAIGKARRRNTGHAAPETVERAVSAPTIPEPWSEYAKPWDHEKMRAKKVLILSDLQIPFHDKPAVEAAVKHGQDQGVTAVLLNGDFMDFYRCSDFSQDPRLRDFRSEIEIGREMLHYIRSCFPGMPIWWKLGNHEERWERFMWNKAAQLVGIEEFEVQYWMHCSKYNVQIVRDKRPIGINKLSVIHGHEYKGGCTGPVNPARTLYLKGHTSALCGHHHQSAEHTGKQLNGKIVTCWSSGCLCGLNPAYMPLNNWNHGAVIVDTSGEDDFTVHNFRIHKGRIF